MKLRELCGGTGDVIGPVSGLWRVRVGWRERCDMPVNEHMEMYSWLTIGGGERASDQDTVHIYLMALARIAWFVTVELYRSHHYHHQSSLLREHLGNSC